MSKLLITVFSILLTNNSFSQILKFKVKESLIKIEMTDGSFSQWRPQVKKEYGSASTLTFDFKLKKMFWDIKFSADLQGMPDENDVYEIENYAIDNEYKDFGFTVIKLKVNRKESSLSYVPTNVELDYQLLFFDVNGISTTYLIDNGDEIKSKYLLELIKGS